MFKIGEFSKLTQVSVRMLRHYDEVGLLLPAEVDQETSYRFYDIQQIPRLNQITFLRDLGFSINEIKTTLNAMAVNPQAIAEVLAAKEQKIATEITRQQERLAKIALAQKDLPQDRLPLNFNVKVKSVPAMQVLSLRKVVASYYSEGAMWKELAAYAQENQLAVNEENATFSIYHDEDYRIENVDIEICAVLPQVVATVATPFAFREVPAVALMASTLVYGPFENINGVFLEFAGWLSQHNQYQMLGESRQIVHRGPWNESDSRNYLTEIQVPLKKIAMGS